MISKLRMLTLKIHLKKKLFRKCIPHRVTIQFGLLKRTLSFQTIYHNQQFGEQTGL